jgi:hypothetical protein
MHRRDLPVCVSSRMIKSTGVSTKSYRSRTAPTHLLARGQRFGGQQDGHDADGREAHGRDVADQRAGPHARQLHQAHVAHERCVPCPYSDEISCESSRAISGGRSLTRPFRDARRFSLYTMVPCTGGYAQDVGVLSIVQGHSLSRRAKP